jgi:CRP-like cAMP-binding protein
MVQTGSAVSWIDGLPAPVREAVLRCMRPRVVEDGDAVYVVGDSGEECYWLRSGRIRITHYAHSGKALQMMELRDGDAFGEVSLIDGLPRSDNAYSAGRSELLVLRRSDFDRLRAQHPEIARELNLHLCRRLRATATHAEDASILTLRERLPRLLNRLVDRHGLRQGSGSAVLDGLSQNDLAQMLGVTRQSVSRALKELEQAGLVRLRYRQILLPDMTDFVERCEQLEGGHSRRAPRQQ